ncbi:hypothetical protein BKH31_08585 [Actinomyces oris]|uniref:Uncharacterized protein n=1 Tax=Actinomyces oris TaxID=544580 RepID=A0A1Q8VCX1_9ACTO|nr:hypothetical protein BKH31_08585 [Actinomyces oris]
MSMVLTSKAHRRRTPKISRRIPTIPTGCFDGWIVNVSAVDTGPRGSESGVLGGGPAPPSQVRPRPAYCTRVGIHWPMVVRTARRAHLRGVPPTLLQQHPTLVQCAQTTPAANGVTGAAPPSDRPKRSSPIWQTHPSGEHEPTSTRYYSDEGPWVSGWVALPPCR